MSPGGPRHGARDRPGRARAALLRLSILPLLLSGCGRDLDADQARLCRMAIPALESEGAAIRVLATRSGQGGREIRVEYSVGLPGRPERRRRIVCGFAASGLQAGKSELISIETPSGTLSGASLHLLRRYWLDTPEAVAAEPPDERSQDLPSLPPGAAYLLQHWLAGLPGLAIYGLLASSYALVFGLVGRINLAFGEIAASGAAGMATAVALGLGAGATSLVAVLLPGLVLALATAALVCVVGGHFTLARPRMGTQASLIATVGLSLTLMETLRLAGGSRRVWLPPILNESVPVARAGEFLVTLTPISLATAGIGLLAAGGLIALMHLSTYGRAWRAYADDPGAAALVGIDGPRLLRTTLALSGAVAGLCGFLMMVQYGALGFADGFGLGLKALIGAVLGGIGSVPGAFLGGLAIGLFESGWSALMPIESRDIALYAVLIAVLAFRPGGILGYGDGTPRRV